MSQLFNLLLSRSSIVGVAVAGLLFVLSGCRPNVAEPLDTGLSSVRTSVVASVDKGASDSGTPEMTVHADGETATATPPSVTLAALASGTINNETFNEDSIKFRICDNTLCVQLGELRLKLGTRATAVDRVKFADDVFTVHTTYAYLCAPESVPEKWSLSRLAARIENFKALKQHRAGQFGAAAGGFAAALQYDASFETARINLSCALAQHGRADTAVEVLLDDNGAIPFERYTKIHLDEDLAPLRTHPMVVAMKSKSVGDVSLPLVPRGLKDFGVAYSADHGLVAVVSTYFSWAIDAHTDYLDVFDEATGELLMRHKLAEFDFETQSQAATDVARRQQKVRHRLESLLRVLNQLGFRVLRKDNMEFAQLNGMGSPPVFPKQKMALLNSTHGVMVLKDRKPYRMFGGASMFGYYEEDTAYIPELDAFVVETHGDEPEGCHSSATMNTAYYFALKNAVAVPSVPLPPASPAVADEPPAARVIERVVSGDSHHCALRRNGDLLCWGSNNSGELGDMASYYAAQVYGHQASPRRVFALLAMRAVRDVAVGENSTCALHQNGTVWCWGANYYWPLARQVASPTQLRGLKNVVELAGRRNSYCAVKKDGTVWCWGKLMQSGDNNYDGALVKIRGLRQVRAVSMAGDWAACALNRNGAVFCWGDNHSGRVGDGSTTHRPRPTKVRVPAAVTQVVMSNEHTCALTGSGMVYCWGDNQCRKAGQPVDVRLQLTPAHVPALNGARVLAAGEAHTCAVTGDSTVQCFGWDNGGAVLGGMNLFADATAELRNVVDLSAAGEHTCAVKSDGTLWCFGMNRIGQFWPGGFDHVREPLRIRGIR